MFERESVIWAETSSIHYRRQIDRDLSLDEQERLRRERRREIGRRYYARHRDRLRAKRHETWVRTGQ